MKHYAQVCGIEFSTGISKQMTNSQKPKVSILLIVECIPQQHEWTTKDLVSNSIYVATS